MRKAAQLFIAWIEIVTLMLVKMAKDRRDVEELSKLADMLTNEMRKVGDE